MLQLYSRYSMPEPQHSTLELKLNVEQPESNTGDECVGWMGIWGVGGSGGGGLGSTRRRGGDRGSLSLLLIVEMLNAVN